VADAAGLSSQEIYGLVEASLYREKLEERISRIPMGEQIYGRFRSYADPSADNPEMKSIIVAIVPNYRYNVPGEFDGVYGKAYMFDSRTDEQAPFFSIRREFSTFLESLGLKCMLGSSYGIPAPARWAAYQAGLGIIRQNNFFYTNNGFDCKAIYEFGVGVFCSGA
jgi:epoxyqueuosine reductase